MLWPSVTASNSDVKGAKGSARLADLPASASGAIVARLQCAACEIAIDEAIVVARRFFGCDLEDPIMMRRQRAGRVGVAGIARQRKRLTAAAAEIDFPEFAALARLRHPAGAAIAVESLGILPDPGDRMIGANGQEFQPCDALGGMARQDFSRWRNVEELPSPAAHAFLRPQCVVVRHDIVDSEDALQPNLRFLDDAVGLLDLLQRRHQRGAVL